VMRRGTFAGPSWWSSWLLLALGVPVLRAEGHATTESPTLPEFDCLDVEAAWPMEKIAWCKQHSVIRVAAAPSLKFHKCDEGEREGWSKEKRLWCCSWHPAAACDSENVEHQAPLQEGHKLRVAIDKFDCLDTQSKHEGAIWSEEKVQWCSKRKGAAVLTSALATSSTPKHHVVSTTRKPDRQHPEAASPDLHRHHEDSISSAKPDDSKVGPSTLGHRADSESARLKEQEHKLPHEKSSFGLGNRNHSQMRQTPEQTQNEAGARTHAAQQGGENIGRSSNGNSGALGSGNAAPANDASSKELTDDHEVVGGRSSGGGPVAAHSTSTVPLAHDNMESNARIQQNETSQTHSKLAQVPEDSDLRLNTKGNAQAHPMDKTPDTHESAESSKLNIDQEAMHANTTYSRSKEEAKSHARRPHRGSALVCESDVAYYPLDMADHGLTIEADVSSCQLRCVRVPRCEHFSFWSLSKHCHLQDASAHKVNQLGFISGPPQCSVSQTTTEASASVDDDGDGDGDDEACLHVDSAYYPLDTPVGRLPVTTSTAVGCQAKCESDDTCAHFSFYAPTGACHMQQSSAEVGGAAEKTSWSAYYLSGAAECPRKAKATIRAEGLDKKTLVANPFLLEQTLGALQDAVAKDVGRGFPLHALQVHLAEGEASQTEFQVTALPTSGMQGRQLIRALKSATEHGVKLNQALTQLTSVVETPEQKFTVVQGRPTMNDDRGPSISLPVLSIIIGMSMIVGGVASLARSGLRGRALGDFLESVKMIPGKCDIEGVSGALPLYSVLSEGTTPQV